MRLEYLVVEYGVLKSNGSAVTVARVDLGGVVGKLGALGAGEGLAGVLDKNFDALGLAMGADSDVAVDGAGEGGVEVFLEGLLQGFRIGIDGDGGVGQVEVEIDGHAGALQAGGLVEGDEDFG